MADANGSIEIEVSINGAEAEAGLAKIGEALKDTSSDVERMGDTVGDTFDELDTGANKTKKEINKLSKQGSKDLDKLGQSAADIKGLDTLKDQTGELDSSLKGLGGAIGLVSPEAERLLFVTGELSGGLEASSRLATLAGTSMRTLAVAGGVLTAALGAAVFVYSQMKSAQEEQIRLAELEAEATVRVADANSRRSGVLAQIRVQTGELSSLEAQSMDLRRRHSAESREDMAEHVRLQGEAIDLDTAEATAAVQNHNRERMARGRLRESERDLMSMRLVAEREASAAADAAHEASLQAQADAEAEIRRAERLARAQDMLNLNRSFSMALLQQIDPATANYAATVNALNEALDQGLDAEIHRASMLQAEIQLEADRAGAVETTTEAIQEQENALAHLGSMQDLLDSQQLERDQALAKSAEDLASAKGTALQGAFALGHQLAGDDAEKQKALAIAQTTISGLEAGIRAFADLGPIAGGIASAGIAAMTAANIASIAGTDVSMHAGGIVGGIGDVGIRAQGGEAVLNREAVAGLGERGVAALNAGGGGSGSITVEMGYKGRIYDRLTIDALRKGGPLSNAMQRAERRGRRGRVGGLL